MKKFRSYVIDEVLTANKDKENNIKIDVAGAFVVLKMTFTSTGNFQIQFRDSTAGMRYWNDKLLNNANIFGVGTYPFELFQPRILLGNTTLQYRIKDTSTSGNTIQIVLTGYETDESPVINKNFRAYVIDATRTANQSIEENLKIDEGSRFHLLSLIGNSTSTYTIRFRDSQDLGHWSDGKINNASIIGTAQLPFHLDSPKILDGGKVLYYTITDTSGSANTIQLALIGYEEFLR